MAALGKCQRKTRMMSTTVIRTSIMVSFTVPMVLWISSERS